MKERITGIISVLGAIGWGITWIFVILYDNTSSVDVLFWLSAWLPLISIVLYVVWTKFGKVEPTEIEKIEYEIQLLKKQIEQQELKKEQQKLKKNTMRGLVV